MGEWITTEDISGETWRRLLEFANIDFAMAAIAKKHGAAEGSRLEKNYRKQAEQIRVSVLQSKEYFEAAGSASLFTSPNHLYYGMASLASAIMLLNGTGEHSLDYLRSDPRNRSHGLHFTTGVTNSNCSQGLCILSESYVEVLLTGFFLNWYGTLPPISEVYAIVETKKPRVSVKQRLMMGQDAVLNPGKMVGCKATILSLLGKLPDMRLSLKRYGYTVAASRANFDVTIYPDEQRRAFRWRIHGAPDPTSLENILRKFKSPGRLSGCWSCTDTEKGELGCIVDFTFSERLLHCDGVIVEWPSLREELNNEWHIYAEDLNTHEIVDGYRASYGLSMLSRYFPDLWIRCLDSHCMAAKVIEQLVFVMIRKFPLLSLRHLTGDDIVISNHAATWHD